jgi:FAD synthase
LGKHGLHLKGEDLLQIDLQLMAITPDRDLVLTIGTFDGVHLGHRHLVRQVARRARELAASAGPSPFTPTHEWW